MPALPTSADPALAAALRRHLLDRFPADRAYPRAAFHAEGMPPLVAAFLDRTLDRWVEAERVRFHSEWFDVEDVNVQRAQRQFFAALRRTARIPASAWEEMLGGAVDLVVRFLTVPARALTDAIFEGTTAPLSTTEVRARLSMFDAYPYLAEVATAYLDRKQPEALDPDALFVLLDRIDRRVVSEYGLEEWLDLLAPLFALARYTPALDGVPTARLQQFFEAKGETGLADLVGEHPALVLDREQLRGVLASAFAEATEPEAAEPATSAPLEPAAEADTAEAPPAAAPSGASTEPAANAEQDPPPVAPLVDEPDADRPAPSEPPPPPSSRTEPPAAPAESDDAHPDRAPSDTAEEPLAEEDTEEPRPLWQRFAERTSDGDSVNARFEPVNAPDHAEAHEAESVPLWKRFFSREDEPLAPPPSAPAPSAPPPARRHSLDALEAAVLGPMPPAKRKEFIKHLFGGDAGKYATVLHTLENAGSWTEASQIIARDVFRPSRVNIYGEHAVAFTDAVEARFRA